MLQLHDYNNGLCNGCHIGSPEDTKTLRSLLTIPGLLWTNAGVHYLGLSSSVSLSSVISHFHCLDHFHMTCTVVGIVC